MAAVAAAMRDSGFAVTGSDNNVYPPMSTFLAAKKIDVLPAYAESNLAVKPDLVVIGNAISRGNPGSRSGSGPETALLFAAGIAQGILHPRQTLPRRLRHAWQNHHDLAFSLGFRAQRIEAQVFSSAACRIISAPGARFTDSPWFIIEGDEYDTAFFDKRSKFVHYLPEVAIVNNLEFDHADIFENLGAVQTAFRRLHQPHSAQRPTPGQRRRPQPGAAAQTHPLPGQTLWPGRGQ